MHVGPVNNGGPPSPAGNGRETDLWSAPAAAASRNLSRLSSCSQRYGFYKSYLRYHGSWGDQGVDRLSSCWCQDRACCLTGIKWYLLLGVAQGLALKALQFETDFIFHFLNFEIIQIFVSTPTSLPCHVFQLVLLCLQNLYVLIAINWFCLTVVFLPLSLVENSLVQFFSGPTTKWQ